MIHQLTHIDPKAKIAANVSIDAFTSIHEDVEIGEGSWIGSNVTIYPGARIGKNVRITNVHGYVNYDDPRGLYVIKDGIVVIPKGTIIQDYSQI